MIGRMYTAKIGAESQSAAKTLLEIAAAADSVVLVERLSINQSTFDTSEQLHTKTQDVTTTGTGSSLIPRPLQRGDSAFGGIVLSNLSAESTYGTAIHQEDGFSVLSGYLWTPANDDEVIVISPSQLVGMNLDVAPSVPMDFSYGATLREIGG